MDKYLLKQTKIEMVKKNAFSDQRNVNLLYSEGLIHPSQDDCHREKA